MEDVQNDPRFAHIATDPRFRPMPKSKRKVKIDSRFQSLFTNRHFSHKTSTDKRGRPILDHAKKNKHVMQRFYDLSSESDSDSETGEEEDNDGSRFLNSRSTLKRRNNTDKLISKKKKEASLSDEPKIQKLSKKRKPGALVHENINTTPGKKFKKACGQKIVEDRNVKRAKKEGIMKKLESKKKGGKKAVQNQEKMTETSDKDSDDDEEEMDWSLNGKDIDESEIDDEEEEGSEEQSDNEEGSDDESDNEEDEEEDSSEEDVGERELPEFTEEYEIEETEVDHKWNELQNDAEAIVDSTSRLAVCNMDWDFIKAQDLFVLFKSFVPEGGSVKSVAIYPSEFGKERMAEEAMLGPKEIREGKKKGNEDFKGKDLLKKDQKKIKESEKNQEAAQIERLREYQLNRLKYYYAVVDCNSVATADTIYKECDGREYQLSSVRLDLRFIPEDMTFDDQPREVFSESQSVVDYQPTSFNSTALSQAKVEVTWDETEFDRIGKQMSMLQQKELESIVETNKYSDFMAPPESDSEDEDGRPEWLKAILTENGDEDEKEITEEEKIRMYRNVLVDKKEEEEEEKRKDEEEVDKVVEWQPGLKSSVETKLKKKSKKKEETTVVSEYLEKRKEKKKKKKAERQQALETEEGGHEAFSDDEIPNDVDLSEFKEMMKEENLDVPTPQQKKKKKKKKLQEEEREDEMNDQEKAELELMLMEEGAKNISKPEIVTDGKKKSKKSKKKLALQKKKENEEKEDFVLDVGDDRFSALYTSHHFHIDPSAPQFKKTKNMLRLVDEQIKRKQGQKVKSGNKKNSKSNHNEDIHVTELKDDFMPSSKSSKEVSQSLIESLKRKMKK